MPSKGFSGLGTTLKREARRLIAGQECGLLDSVGLPTRQGKLWFGNTRLFHSLTFNDLHAPIRPGTLTAHLNLPLVNWRRNISTVGALSWMFSIRSLSGPSFQVCGYHVDCLLPESSNFHLGIEPWEPTMAIRGSREVLSDRSLNTVNRKQRYIYSTAIVHSTRSFSHCRKASLDLRNKEQSNDLFLRGYFMFNSMKAKGNSIPYLGFAQKGFHVSSPACSLAGTAHDMPFENTGCFEQHESAAVASNMKNLPERELKLVSGSCYLPHPKKEDTGGEDAHFICDEVAIGVADGVGGWADLGVDAGKFSRELMSNSVAAIQEEPKGSVDPAKVLEKAHSSTKAEGSSTACIIALTDKGLHAINLGDSGFLVVRDGCTVFRSPIQQHDFNFSYQLERGNNGDLPSSGQVFRISVDIGDVVIAGTDGLFDNLYNNEVTAVVVHAVRAGLGPQVAAQKIAALARQRAEDKNRQTPFSTAAQDAGFRYYGGKLDDITVVVSYITGSTNESSHSGRNSG
ncbi:Phosphoprotein phosphatase [Bertholletia excelsa]